MKPDGVDATQGAKADTAITDSTQSGTIVSFIKGLVKILNDVWDSTSHLLRFSMSSNLLRTVDSVTSRPEATTPINLTASGIVRTGPGILVGMYVNSTGGGTVKLWNNTSAATPVLNDTMTPAIGYHPLGNAEFGTGVYATISGTINITFYFIPTP